VLVVDVGLAPTQHLFKSIHSFRCPLSPNYPQIVRGTYWVSYDFDAVNPIELGFFNVAARKDSVAQIVRTPLFESFC